MGVTTGNLSMLKQGHARAVRFSRLEKVCEACRPGDLLEYALADNE